MSHGEELEEASEQLWRSLPKTLFALSQCRITEDDSSRSLLSRSHMHVDERDKVASTTQQQKWQNLNALVFFVFVHVTCSVVTVRIYKEDPSRITASHNRLGLSLWKRIRHRLIAKINGKRRPRTCEALSRVRQTIHTHVVHPCPSPRHAPHPPGEAIEHACVFLFLICYTHLQVHREQPNL
jgi:hypothetical protein